MVMLTPNALVSFDTDRVKDYVFATSKLTEVRGASALLEQLNRHETDQTVAEVLGLPEIGDHHIYAAGGSAMYKVPADRAEEVIQAVERLYREKTITASTTGDKALLDGRPFGEVRGEVGRKLRQKKDARGRSAILPVAPYLQFCESCGLHPAAQVVREPDATAKNLCLACAIKRERGQPNKVSLFWNEFQKAAAKAGQGAEWDVERPRDFTEIGALSHPSGYIGLIYCDGNQMGKFFEQLNTEQDYRQRSTLVDEAIRNATYRTLLTRYKPQSPAPFEVLLLGGDDLLLVTTADQALAVAIGISELFEQLAPRPLTLSTGVVLAHDDFPVARMRELADELLKQAKRKSFEADNVSTVDYAVVTAASAGDLERTREEVLTNRGFARQLDAPEGVEIEITHWMTERPYTVSDLKKLLENAQNLAKVGFPRSRLQAMYEALFVSERAAMTAATMGVARTTQKRHYDAIKRFFADFGVNIQAPEFPPWRRDQGKVIQTALGDLVEIYPFVGRR